MLVCDFLACGPIEILSIILLLKVGLSNELRVEIIPLWTTTSSSFHFAPELIKSFFNERLVVNVRPFVNPDQIKNCVPSQI